MKMIFDDHLVKEVVEGTTPVPGQGATPQEREEYARKNRRALRLMGLNLDDSHMCYVQEHEYARDAWAALERVNQRATSQREHHVRRKLQVIRQEEGESILKYAGRARTMALELRSLGFQMDEQTFIGYVLEGALPEYEESVKVLRNSTRQEVFEDVVNVLETAEARRERDLLERAKYGGGGGRQQGLRAQGQVELGLRATRRGLRETRHASTTRSQGTSSEIALSTRRRWRRARCHRGRVEVTTKGMEVKGASMLMLPWRCGWTLSSTTKLGA
jgi:hypothetical protein